MNTASYLKNKAFSARLHTRHVGPSIRIGLDRRRESHNVIGEYAAGMAAKVALRPRSRWGIYYAAASLAVLSIAASGMAPQSGIGEPADASTVHECSTSELQVMFVPETPGQGTKGAVFLQDISAHACSVSGQPTI